MQCPQESSAFLPCPVPPSHPASPGQALEELAHGHEIELIRAVEHNSLDGQGLAQVFGSFCFSCASWASWCTPKLEMQGTSQGQIAPAGVRGGMHGPCNFFRIPTGTRRESLPILFPDDEQFLFLLPLMAPGSQVLVTGVKIAAFAQCFSSPPCGRAAPSSETH